VILLVALVTIAGGWALALAATAQAVGPATAISLSLSPSSIVADGTSTTTATVRVTDNSVPPVGVAGEKVALSSSDPGEKIGTVTDAGNGIYTATITSSTAVGAATITATDGGISGQATLTQTAGPPTSVSVALSPAAIVANGASTSAAKATVTDAHGHPLPGQSVKFSSSDPGERIGTVTDAGNGTYTATITSSTTVGAPTITAADGTVSGQATLTQTVGSAANVEVTLNPASISADGISTTTATATVTDAQGRVLPAERVAFSSTDRAERIGATKNAGNGTYTATITASTTVGTPTITATDGSAAGRAILTQTAGPPASITVQVSPGAIVADGSSTATATATVIDGQGHLVPNDAIIFSSSDPGQFFGPVFNHGDGTYSAVVRSSTRVGPATITATDPSRVSSHTTLTQAAGPSSMSLVATPSTSVTNQGVTLFAVVAASTGSPSGTITFESGAAPIAGCVGEPITPSNPTASCQTSFAASTSPERLTALFTPGPASTAPGAVGTTTVVVRQDLPSVSVAVAGSVQVGQSTSYSATVAPPGSRPGPVLPSGSVAFTDDGQPVASCRSQPLVSGTASCALTYTALGKHTITASYSGDANFAGATSAAQTITVVRAPVHVLGVVTSTMQWLFSFTRRYTKVLAFGIKRASAAASILITCHGRGCPFVNRTSKVAKPKGCGKKGKPRCPASGSLNLAPAFKHRLRVGTTIAVLITRPGWIGKYYKFVTRAGRGPRIAIDCIAPRGTRPGVGC
jgi:hypothetical protein